MDFEKFNPEAVYKVEPADYLEVFLGGDGDQAEKTHQTHEWKIDHGTT